MAMNLRERVIGRLQNLPDTKLAARELAQWVFDEFPDECAFKNAGSARLVADQSVGSLGAVSIKRASDVAEF